MIDAPRLPYHRGQRIKIRTKPPEPPQYGTVESVTFSMGGVCFVRYDNNETHWVPFRFIDELTVPAGPADADSSSSDPLP